MFTTERPILLHFQSDKRGPAGTHTHTLHAWRLSQFSPLHLAVADSGASSALRRSALIPIVRLDLPRHHLTLKVAMQGFGSVHTSTITFNKLLV